MVVNYELTAADFREAAAHHQRSAIRQRLIRRVRKMGVANMVTFATIFLAYFLLRQLIPSMESLERARSQLAQSADILLPAFAVVAIIVPVQALAGVLRAPNWRAIGGAALSLLLLAVTLGLLYFSTTLSTRGVARWPSLPLSAVLAPHMSWLAFVLIVATLIIRTRSLNTRLTWSGQQHLHLPFTMDASVSGLTLVTPNVRNEYSWNGVTAFVETPNLFLIHVSDLAFHIVPKRGFTSAEELDAFRNMLRNLIPSTKPAFEVLPAAAGHASAEER